MSAAVSLRRCGADDARALALVGRATFLETFAGVLDGPDIERHCARQHTAALYARWLAQADTRLWLAEAEPGHAPVGYLAMCPSTLPLDGARADDLEIKRIYLLHRFQGGGLGRRLMEQALADAHGRTGRVLLGVYAGNATAQAFYARMGFRQVGSRRFRVGSRGYDDCILALDLPQRPALSDASMAIERA